MAFREIVIKLTNQWGLWTFPCQPGVDGSDVSQCRELLPLRQSCRQDRPTRSSSFPTIRKLKNYDVSMTITDHDMHAEK